MNEEETKLALVNLEYSWAWQKLDNILASKVKLNEDYGLSREQTAAFREVRMLMEYLKK